MTISGRNSSRVFEIDSNVTASLSRLTITGGSATGSGGGLYNDGTATLANCTVSGNSASTGGGGGLYNDGTATLTLTDCTVSGNSAGTGGGLDNESTATLTHDCTVSGNSASTGGGLYNDGKATLYACTVSGNSASTGGGLYGTNSATLNITDTIVAGNTFPDNEASDISGTAQGVNNLIGTGGSGGLTSGTNANVVLTSLATLGLAPLANNGGPTQTMALLAGSPAIEAGTAVSGITTDQRGQPLDTPVPDIGAFQTQTDQVSSRTLIVTHPADDGSNGTLRWAVSEANSAKGPIDIELELGSTAATIILSQGQLELSNTSQPVTIYDDPAQGPVTISGNNASRVFQVDQGVTASLSGLTISAGSTSGSGGGLYVKGTATLEACTISGNSAKDGGGLASAGTTTLTNCTISGNSAGSNGGGLYEPSGGTATLTDCTVSGNTANTGGGLDSMTTATLNLKNTIVAGNTLSSKSASDISGTATGTNNLIGTGGSGGLTNGQSGNIVLTSDTGLDLGPLANHGGPTLTMDLLPGSLALGAGIAVTAITTDQRGLPRSNNGAVDIGAVEDQVSLTTPATANATSGTNALIQLGSFSDAATFTNPQYKVLVNWGDGTVAAPDTTTLTPTSPGSLSAFHTYAAQGTYDVTVTVADANGDASTSASPEVVTVGKGQGNGQSNTVKAGGLEFVTVSGGSFTISGSVYTVSSGVQFGFVPSSGSFTPLAELDGNVTIDTTRPDRRGLGHAQRGHQRDADPLAQCRSGHDQHHDPGQRGTLQAVRSDPHGGRHHIYT